MTHIPVSVSFFCPSNVNFTAVIPWRSVNFMDYDDGVLTSNVLLHMAHDVDLQAISDLQAFTTQTVSSHTVDREDATSDSKLRLSIINASRTNKKTKSEVKIYVPPGSLVHLLKKSLRETVATIAEKDKLVKQM